MDEAATAEDVAVTVQDDLADIATELTRLARRVLKQRQRLVRPYPEAELQGRGPISLPHRLFGELRDVAAAIEAAAREASSTASRTAEEIGAEWLEARAG